MSDEMTGAPPPQDDPGILDRLVAMLMALRNRREVDPETGQPLETEIPPAAGPDDQELPPPIAEMGTDVGFQEGVSKALPIGREPMMRKRKQYEEIDNNMK